MFPGEKSPGLIEARFRSTSAGGSRLVTFPGEKSPGLIEAAASWKTRAPVPAAFPGEKSPGLIEAPGAAGPAAPWRVRVSGGEIPRPH